MSFSWGHPRLCLTFCSWQIKNDSCLSISIHSSVFFLKQLFIQHCDHDFFIFCHNRYRGCVLVPPRRRHNTFKTVENMAEANYFRVNTHSLVTHEYVFFLYLFPLLPPLERFHVMDTSDGEGGGGEARGGGRTHPEGKPGYITAASIFFFRIDHIFNRFVPSFTPL